MPGRSYLSGPDVNLINQVRRDILATRIALQGEQSVTLRRLNPSSGLMVSIPAQIVDVKLDQTGGGVALNPGEAAMTSRISGRLRKETPFDVKPGDRFMLPEGWSASVTLVDDESPANIITAYFTANTGALA